MSFVSPWLCFNHITKYHDIKTLKVPTKCSRPGKNKIPFCNIRSTGWVLTYLQSQGTF